MNIQVGKFFREKMRDISNIDAGAARLTTKSKCTMAKEEENTKIGL